ncbi:MAG: DUF3025 domain-containing protein [Thiobacillus sp.]|nr:DUF3025 domain-containing protein [Thiobacillus sp.]
MNFAHPAFAPYRALIDALGLEHRLPTLDALNALATEREIRQARGLPLRFVAPACRHSARDYETRILETGAVPTRADTWHDALNALVWLRFPRFKAALNAAHGEAIAAETNAARGRRRDALTVLDESGVWVLGNDAGLYDLLVDHAWEALFVHRRHAVVCHMRFIVIGHALLEKALAPYASMTGKCLWLAEAAGDSEAAACAALGAIATPRRLAPLPIQGIPGWDPANGQADYYANAEVFRPARAALTADDTAG